MQIGDSQLVLTHHDPSLSRVSREYIWDLGTHRGKRSHAAQLAAQRLIGKISCDTC